MAEIVSQDQMEIRIKGLEEHIRAENEHDVEAIMNTFASDGVLVFNGTPLGNHAVIRTLHEQLGFGENGGFSDLRIDVKHRYVSEEAITLEQVVTGTHTGKWQGISPTGRKIAVAVCTVYKFDREGKLVSENVYMDTGGMLKQLGAI